MAFLSIENSHNHTFETIAANTAEPWLRQMARGTFKLPQQISDDIFGLNSAAQVLLFRWPQSQADVLDETSGLAISYTATDSIGITRMFVPYIARRKKHQRSCMGDFVGRIETQAREVGASVLTIVAGNIQPNVFESRGYKTDVGSSVGIPPAFQRTLPV